MKVNYVDMPINFYKIKQKYFLNLTKRQFIGLLIGAACGIIPFLIVLSLSGITNAALTLAIFSLPAIFISQYEKNGIKLEKYVKLIINFHRQPKKRIYRSRNITEYVELISEKQELERILRNG